MRYNLKWPLLALHFLNWSTGQCFTWEKLVLLIQVNRNQVNQSTCNNQFYSSNISKLNQTFSGLLYHSSCKLGTAGLSTNKSTTEGVTKYIQLRYRQDKRFDWKRNRAVNLRSQFRESWHISSTRTEEVLPWGRWFCLKFFLLIPQQMLCIRHLWVKGMSGVLKGSNASNQWSWQL